MSEMSLKPLGHKAYGSIGHLPDSRMGPADHKITDGQAAICTVKARDKHDRIIVTEKLDGSNVAVANVGGIVVPLSRAGYAAMSSPFQMHHVFHRWVMARSWNPLPVGWRVSGEWLSVAHGTMYDVTVPFIAFDVFDDKNKRINHDMARAMFAELGLIGAYVVSDGLPISIEDALSALGPTGRHGATEAIEGAVWRVERKGVFDFAAKYVRPDKVDGKYLSGVTGGDEVPMWRGELVGLAGVEPTTGEV